MKFDYEIQKQLFICMIAAVCILSGIVIYQSIQVQDLTSKIDSVLNDFTPMNLNLIDHLNCNELKEWKSILDSDNSSQKITFNTILSNSVITTMNNKFC